MIPEEATTPPDHARAGKPGLSEWLQRELYLTRVEWFLDSLVPGHERKRIIRVLREDIAAESPANRIPQVLAGLGDPKELALSYAGDAAVQRPRWNTGVIAGGAALLLYWVVFCAYVFGMLAVVEQAGIGEAQSRFLFIEVSAFADASHIGFGWDSGIAWLLVPLTVVAVVFLVASRAWRLLRGKTG